MAHIHSVVDSNEHFVIDPVTRSITNSLAKKISVMQYDHNSERFTFEIPKLVDGHNMSVCDKVEIHYINVDAVDKTLKSTGVYEVKDIQVSPEDDSVAVFSWLLSRNCTKYAGTLSFLIHFACTTDGVEDYAWNTAIFQSITIGNGMNNGAEVIEPYADIIAQWKADLFGVGDTEEQRLLTVSAEQQAAIAAKGAAVLDSIPDEYEALQTGVDTLFNSVASGIRGNISGTVVRADDVSPVVHNPVVEVHGKNLFNINALEVMPANYTVRISAVDVENNSFTITTAESHDGNGYCGLTNATGNYAPTLRDLCPQLKVGKTYVLSGKTDSRSTFIYLRDVSRSWVFGKPLTITEECLNAKIAMYGLDFAGGEGAGDCVISNIQVEEGTTATEYTPYIDPATVTVARCGKNFWHSRDLSYPRTVSGVTINYDPVSQIYTFNGTSTSPGDIYTVPNGADIMHINAGETWTLKVEVMGGNVDGVATCSGKMSPLVNTAGYTNTIHANTESLYVTKTYTEAADITKMYFYVYASGIVFNNFRCRIQFEPNSKPTAFEKFKDLSEYIPAADGIVSGMTSLSPCMTVLTDTPGVTVDCEYIVDTKTYIDNKISEMLKGGEEA